MIAEHDDCRRQIRAAESKHFCTFYCDVILMVASAMYADFI